VIRRPIAGLCDLLSDRGEIAELEFAASGRACVARRHYIDRSAIGYMRPGINCAVTAYPDVEKLVEQIATVLGDPGYAEALAEAGRMTANSHVYTYKPFRAAWRKQFSVALGSVPRQENLRAA
jgi:hypothetical protein